jgi:hypothetical protein
MIKLLLVILSSIISFAGFAQDVTPPLDNSLNQSMMPKFYKKRTEPVLNIGLIYYGDYYTMDDLTRVQGLLEERFLKATGELLRLNTVSKAVLPFKKKITSFPDYWLENITDPERLQRLWYFDNVGMGVAKEVYELIKNEVSEIKLEELDSLVIVTGAQFEALGFATGRLAVTENPMEIAWGRPNGGWVDYVTDARVVDELIHEIGHTIFIDHTSKQCQKPGMDYKEMEACCEESPAKDDVMSYCRKRKKVDENFFYGFKDCNLRIIKNQIIPALLNGSAWALPERETCP